MTGGWGGGGGGVTKGGRSAMLVLHFAKENDGVIVNVLSAVAEVTVIV